MLEWMLFAVIVLVVGSVCGVVGANTFSRRRRAHRLLTPAFVSAAVNSHRQSIHQQQHTLQHTPHAQHPGSWQPGAVASAGVGGVVDTSRPPESPRDGGSVVRRRKPALVIDTQSEAVTPVSVTSVTIPHISTCDSADDVEVKEALHATLPGRSMTDRVSLHLSFAAAPELASPVSPSGAWMDTPQQPPRRCIAKAPLLSPHLRWLSSPVVMTAASWAAAALRPCGVDSLVVWMVQLVGHVFPQVPDTLSNNEALFYRHVRPFLPPRAVSVPAVYGSWIDTRRRTCCVLLQDLVLSGARFPTARHSMHLRTLQSALGSLAAVHAAHWQSPRLANHAHSDLAWVPTPGELRHACMRHRVGLSVMRVALRAVAAATQAHAQGRAPAQAQARAQAQAATVALRDQSPEDMWNASRVADQVLSQPPFTLCHGQAHVQHMYVLPRGTAGWLGWQWCTRSSWAVDVAAAIGSALSVPERQTHLPGLLALYLDRLRVHGVVHVPGVDAAHRLVACAMARCLVDWLVEPPSKYGWSTWIANVARLATACDDMGTFDLLSKA